MFGKNDVLVESGRGLTDYELVTSVRNWHIVGTSKFRDDVHRQTLTMEFANQLALGQAGRKFRADSPLYMRAVGKQLRNYFYGNSKLGDSDTYDHTRKMQ